MSGEIYGQANRYGNGIRDMSDFRSGFDADLTMGENESTALARDDTREPITAEWLESVKTNAICGFWYERDMVVWYRKRDVIEFPGCKTHGDFRELCRLLRFDLK